MNTASVRSAARERLLDASLLEVLTGSAATATPVAAQLPQRPLQAWVAAALLLLGIGVAAGVWISSTPPGASLARQGGEPLPPAIKVTGEAISALDATCTNLNWEDVQPAHLPLLGRFPHLRRLRINPDTAPGRPAAWQTATAADLQPVCALEELEDLHLPFCWQLTPAHLQRLGTCKRLSVLSLVNQSVVLDEAVVGELAKWPALRELHLLAIALTGKGLAALAQIPHLQGLSLWHCRDLDAEGVAAVAKSAGLRRLELVGLGRPDPRAAPDQQASASWALTSRAMAAIAHMPALHELSLRDCVLTDEVLAALPDALKSLDLAGVEGVPAAALRGLRRLGNLRSLAIGGAADADGLDEQVASLLGTLHLEKLDWQGMFTPAIVAAVTAQPDLRELGLSWHDGLDLAFVARLQKLEVLGITARSTPARALGPVAAQVSQPTAADLQPLRQCRSLQRVELHGVRATDQLAGLRSALGPLIALWLVE